VAFYIITPREGAFRAQVRVKVRGKVVHAETRSFQKRTAAEAWAKRRVLELEEQTPAEMQAGRLTVSDMIGRYLKEYADLADFGRTKRAALGGLQRSGLGPVTLAQLTSARLVQHVIDRRNAGAGPATAMNDLIWLGVVAKVARASWALPVDLQAIEDATRHCRAQRLVAKARRRTRRPTADELSRLSDYFLSRDGRAEIPMHDVMWFAVHSSRREAEIASILWADNVDAEHTGLVRDAKHPTMKKGNHRVFKYTREAWEIVQRQPKVDARIFPFNAKSIGTAFTRACKVLEIPDLHFHDLRHEATSRLFERGHSIVEVQQFTLHESWDVLKRYVQLRPGQVPHREFPAALSPSTDPDTSPDPQQG